MYALLGHALQECLRLAYLQIRSSFLLCLFMLRKQKLIPNHRFSFCCVYLLLLTRLTIRSSCPPSHHWASQTFHFVGLNPISMVGLSRWPGEGRYPQNINWSLGFLRDRFFDPSSVHIHYITGSHHTGTWFHISAWMKEHHLQLNLAKTEHLVFPAISTLQHDFTTQLGSSTITPSSSVRNLGVMFDDQLTFKDHIAKTARSSRFALHNIRKIRPFLTQHAAQLLVQALVISRLDYCNALLAGLPLCTIKPLQMIQNAAARLVFCEPKRAHVTPLFISLHWLPVAACIKFKTLMLAYRTATGSVPAYFHSLMTIYIPSRSLRFTSERHLVVPSQRGTKSLSRTFSFTVPGWWNELPTLIRNAESLTIFK